jgi:acyl dehydratase
MTTEERVFEYDESVIGKEFEMGSREITREHIRRFCEVLGETNPLYTDDAAAAAGPYGSVIAPPGLVYSLSVGQGPDAKLKFGNATFHSGERAELHAVVRPGDVISAKQFIKEVYPKTGRSGTMVFVVRRTEFRNQNDELVAAVEQSMVSREV